MAYTTVAKIRTYTDLTDQEVTDDELTKQFIPDAEKIADFETGRPWTSSDTSFEIVSLATTWLVAWLVYKKLLDSDKAEKYHTSAMNELAKLKTPVGPVTHIEQ